MGPVLWPHHFFHENSTLIHNKTLGHPGCAVEMLHQTFCIKQRREAETVVLHKRRHHLRSQWIEADREDFEPTTVQTLIELLDCGHFLNAWLTPRRPNVDKHDLAPQSGKLDRPTVQVW